jgi:hypothetical protein
MSENKNLSQIIEDLEDFIQREGLSMEKQLLRAKLRYLHQNLYFGKQKSVVRGLLSRLNKIDNGEQLIRTIDIVKSLHTRRNLIKSIRKITLTRFIEPTDTLIWFSNESYPLKIEYT